MSFNSKYTGAEVEEALAKAKTALQAIPSNYATKDEVANAIAESITNALNTEV